MLLFSCFLATVINFNTGVRAYIQIAIGEDSFIPPNEIASTQVWQTNPPAPSTHPGYEVTNIGNAAIRASIYWKDSWPLQTDDVFCEARLNCSPNSSVNVWYELAAPIHIEPSTSAVIRPSTKANFYFTRLVVISNLTENNSHLKAIVHIEYENGGVRRKRDINTNSNTSACGNAKIVFKFGGSKLPVAVATSGAEALIELFWPENKTSVWDEVRDKVKNLIDKETFGSINALLTGRLMAFKRKLELVAREVEGQSGGSVYYMNLAQDFIGLEEESIIRGHHNAKKLNDDLLPVYSNIILMKAAFYSLGVKCQQRIGLSNQNVASLKTYFADMIRSQTHGANQYIALIFRNQSDSNFTYNKEMFMRNKITEHGYIPIWNNMLDHPGEKLVPDEIYYSNFWGGHYVGMDVFPPSIDQLNFYRSSNGEYNDIQKLILYQSADGSCVEDCCVGVIIGMKVIFKDGNTSEFGKMTHIYRVVELNGAYQIRSIEARRFDKEYNLVNLRISLLKLNKVDEGKNSTQEEYTFGCLTNKTPSLHSFAKENYYIASIFASFDSGPSAHSLLNMGVSFLPLKSNLDYTVDETNWKEWIC